VAALSNVLQAYDEVAAPSQVEALSISPPASIFPTFPTFCTPTYPTTIMRPPKVCALDMLPSIPTVPTVPIAPTAPIIWLDPPLTNPPIRFPCSVGTSPSVPFTPTVPTVPIAPTVPIVPTAPTIRLGPSLKNPPTRFPCSVGASPSVPFVPAVSLHPGSKVSFATSPSGAVPDTRLCNYGPPLVSRQDTVPSSGSIVSCSNSPVTNVGGNRGMDSRCTDDYSADDGSILIPSQFAPHYNPIAFMFSCNGVYQKVRELKGNPCRVLNSRYASDTVMVRCEYPIRYVCTVSNNTITSRNICFITYDADVYFSLATYSLLIQTSIGEMVPDGKVRLGKYILEKRLADPRSHPLRSAILRQMIDIDKFSARTSKRL